MAGSSTKFAYLNSTSIQPKIDSNILDAMDLVITKDTHELIFITDTLSQLKIHSKVYTYDSIYDAEIALNSNQDTYQGQIVAIKNVMGDYNLYVVNYKGGQFVVSSSNGGGVKQYINYLAFPSIGDASMTYYDNTDRKAYIYDNIALKYVCVGGGKVKAEDLLVDEINGGNAIK